MVLSFLPRGGHVEDMLFEPFQEKIDLVLGDAKKAGLDVALFDGFRSFQRQDDLYAQGRTKPGKKVTKARGGQSWHNYGLAADLVFKRDGKWTWDGNWDVLGRIGKRHGLLWGGDWKGFKDRPHFEWPRSLSLVQAKGLHDKGGLDLVWKEVEKESV